MGEAVGSAIRWRSRCFGIELDLGFEAPVFATAPHGAAGIPTRVELASEATIRAAWPEAEARRTGLMGSEDDPCGCGASLRPGAAALAAGAGTLLLVCLGGSGRRF